MKYLFICLLFSSSIFAHDEQEKEIKILKQRLKEMEMRLKEIPITHQNGEVNLSSKGKLTISAPLIEIMGASVLNLRSNSSISIRSLLIDFNGGKRPICARGDKLINNVLGCDNSKMLVP